MDVKTCLEENVRFQFRWLYSLYNQQQYFCISGGVFCFFGGYQASGRGQPIYNNGNIILNWPNYSIVQYHYLIKFYLRTLTTMISLKRQSPSLHSNTIVIDSQSQEVPAKNSMKKVKTTSEVAQSVSPYESIPQVPNVKLTVQQMNSDPLELFKLLEATYLQYGAVKLTVSQAWNCPFTFGFVDRPVTIRLQTLQQLTEGKPFEQKVQSLRISEFKENALNFTKTYKFKTSPQGTTSESKREHQYWNLVTKPQFASQEVTVQYAADLPSSLYGSGFPTRKMHNWLDADFEYETNLFNLNNLYKSKTSLLQVIDEKKEKVSGITLPWMYAGMQFATFCWHVQDLFLNSINYNHIGETKTWYVIPGKYKEAFDQYVKVKYESARKKNLLQKITLLVDPLQLIKAGIKVYKAHQRARDYVVTFIKAYHCGFSHGYNVCQAVNFVSYDSIDAMKESYRFYEEQEISQNKKLKSHVLSYQWMIYQTVNQKLLCQSSPYYQKVMKEYRRVLNRQYVLIKSTLDKYGDYTDVKPINSKKRYYCNLCSHCKNYLYLSSLECAKCRKNLCERHLSHCECETKQWILNVRELNQDREKLQDVVPLIKTKFNQLK